MRYKIVSIISILSVVLLTGCSSSSDSEPSAQSNGGEEDISSPSNTDNLDNLAVDENTTDIDVIDQEDDTPMQVVPAFDFPPKRLLAIEFSLLQQITDTPSAYVASTTFEEHLIDDSGTSTLQFSLSDNGALLFVSDESESPLLIHFVNPAQGANGELLLDAHSMARGLIAINPLLTTFAGEDRLAIISASKDHELYEKLILRIEESVRRKRIDMLEENDPVGILAISANIAAELVGPLDMSLQRQLRAAGDTFGTDSAPYIRDEIGEDVSVINPTLAFYGVQINANQQFILAGKEKYWSLRGSTDATADVIEPVILNDGVNTIVFESGLDVESDIGRAALFANSINLFCHVADLLIFCPLTNESTAELGALLLSSDDTELVLMFEGLLKQIRSKSFSIAVDFLHSPTSNQRWATETNFNRMWRFISKGADQRVGLNNKFVKNSKKLLSGLKRLTAVLTVVDTTQKIAPFLLHFATKPSKLTYCITNRAGDLVNTCEEQSRVPNPVVVADRNEVVEGAVVEFQVSAQSMPQIGPQELLEYRWDVGNDSTIESDWSADATALNHIFDVPGTFSVRVDARNQSGVVGSTATSVVVLGARSRTIALRHPEAGGRPVPITVVEMKTNETRLTFENSSRRGICWYGDGENSPYLLVNNVKHSLRETVNVVVCSGSSPASTATQSDDISDIEFQLVFDPLPLSSTEFDLIEGEAAERGEARFFNYFGVSVPITSL